MMTENTNFKTLLFHAPLGKRMLIGTAIFLSLIILFLVQAGTPDPEWGWSKFYFVQPLIVLPFAGATAGAFFHFMDCLRLVKGWNRIVVYAISFVVSVFGLWMGTVIGLHGTYWN